MGKEVVIIGAGGHGSVVKDIVLQSGDTLLGFLDDGNNQNPEVIGRVEDCVKYKNKYVIIAIGDNKTRRRIAERYPELNYYTAIHPSAVIGSGVEIKKGSCVMPCAVINARSSIGEHCIINTHATVEHDCTVKDYTHISPGSIVCGTVVIGENTQIGAGAVVKNNICICDNVVVGSGGAVVKNIVDPGIYVGVPAKKKV